MTGSAEPSAPSTDEPERRDRPERDALDKTFDIALILKGLDGLLELVGGIVLIVVGLFRRERWAYPVAFVFLGGFVVYQVYRMTYAPSVGLALLTVFDLFIIWLTWREYRRMKTSRIGVATAPS